MGCKKAKIRFVGVGLVALGEDRAPAAAQRRQEGHCQWQGLAEHRCRCRFGPSAPSPLFASNRGSCVPERRDGWVATSGDL